jgi:hypothetical protein
MTAYHIVYKRLVPVFAWGKPAKQENIINWNSYTSRRRVVANTYQDAIEKLATAIRKRHGQLATIVVFTVWTRSNIEGQNWNVVYQKGKTENEKQEETSTPN